MLPSYSVSSSTRSSLAMSCRTGPIILEAAPRNYTLQRSLLTTPVSQSLQSRLYFRLSYNLSDSFSHALNQRKTIGYETNNIHMS